MRRGFDDVPMQNCDPMFGRNRTSKTSQDQMKAPRDDVDRSSNSLRPDRTTIIKLKLQSISRVDRRRAFPTSFRFSCKVFGFGPFFTGPRIQTLIQSTSDSNFVYDPYPYSSMCGSEATSPNDMSELELSFVDPIRKSHASLNRLTLSNE